MNPPKLQPPDDAKCRVGAFRTTAKSDLGYTPKKNIEPKNEGLEDVFPFQMGDFQVPC